MARQKKEVEEKIDFTKADQDDILASDVLEAINAKFKNNKNSIGFLSNANLVDTWVSTGSSMLDLAIANKSGGGLGFGMICEIFGPSASAKSLLAAHILAETQKLGGLSVLFDTENAVGMLDFYQSIGLDVKRTLYSDKLRALEEIFSAIESIIEKSVKINPDRPITIVVDSVMGATTLLELEADYEKEGWATSKSIILSKAMRKITSLIVGRKILLIFVNQVRSRLGVTFGDNLGTSGGFAIGFHSSVRLRTKVLGKLKGDINGLDAEIGNRVQVTVSKNRLGPPGRSVTFDIYYDSGIDDFGSWLNALKDFGFLKQSGAWYTYEYIIEETGELIQKKFQSKDFKRLLEENPVLKDTIYRQICDAYVMKYDIEEFGTDLVRVDEVTEHENEE